MSNTAIDTATPEFQVAATNNKDIHLSALTGYSIILYFYPKDHTPGCTTESEGFRDTYQKLKANKTIVFGVSRDPLKSHEKFKTKLNLPFELISDEDESLCKLFDVIKLKNLYGKKFMGIERSTFLIDAEGVLRKEWRKVKVTGHVDEVVAAALAL